MLSAACFLGAPQAGAAGIQRTLWLGPPLPHHVTLPDSFVIWDSFTVSSRDSTLRLGSDFRLDLLRNQVQFAAGLGESTVCATYRFLPLGIPPLLQRRTQPAAGEDVAATAPAQGVRGYPVDLSAEAGIHVAGTKTIGVRFGSGRDPSLDQALQIQVGGTLAGDVEVTASLSDERTPIQPEGTTQELRDVDRVVIELKRKGLGVSVGDCAIATDGFRFLGIQRKMQGMAGSLDEAAWHGTVAAAQSKGAFTTVEFMGAEGTQGPYGLARFLSPPSGRITVVAGTERVWIDGEPVMRGTDKDYVIDYSTGDLTFTERRPLTAQHRITVDFQYTAESFRRTLYAATAARALTDAVVVRAGVFREADDAGQPMEWNLGDLERAALAAAGDDEEAAVVPTYRFVGFGAGRYDTLHVAFLVPEEGGGWSAQFDSVGTGRGSYRRMAGRFEYFGPGGGPFHARAESTGSGQYGLRRAVILVSGESPHRFPEGSGVDLHAGEPAVLGGSFDALFYRENGGDYVRLDAHTWAYAGPGHGDYVAHKSVPMPRAHQIAVGGVAAGWGILRVDVEGAVSSRDANTLSSRDDGDNESGAVDAQVSARREGGVLPWWETRVAWRSEGASFATPGRSRPVDWARDWTAGGQGSLDEGTVDVALGLPWNGRLGLVAARLRRGSIQSSRAQSTGTLNGPVGFTLAGRYNRSAGANATRWWTDGSLERRGWWSPLAVWKGEASDVPAGQGYGQLGAGVRLGGGAMSARVLAGRRTTKERAESPARWVRSATGAWWEVGMAASRGASASGRVDLTHTRTRTTEAYRRLRGEQGLSVPDDVSSSVGAARASFMPPAWGLRLDLDYKVSGRQSERMVEELIPEEPWETNVGEYDSLGTWVGPEVGTHKKELVPSGGAERVNQVEGIAALRMAPGSRGPGWRRHVSGDLTGRIQVSSRTDRLTDLYLLRPDAVLADSAMLRHSSRLDGSVYVRPTSGELAVGGQVAYSFDADNRRTDRRTQRETIRWGLRTRGVKLGRGLADLSAYHARTRDTETPLGQGATVETRSRINGITPSASMPLGGRWEAVGSGEVSREHATRRLSADSTAVDAVLRTLTLTPGLRLAVPGKGRIRLETEFAWRWADGPWSRLAPFLRRTDQVGASRLVKGGGEYKLQEKLTLNVSLSFGSVPGRGRVREGTMEVTAYF